MKAIVEYLDNYLEKTGQISIDPVSANEILAKAKFLSDSKNRPGKPVRELLRRGQLPHAYQSGGKGSSWTIPHSSKQKLISSKYQPGPTKKVYQTRSKSKNIGALDVSVLKIQLEKARLKYKPNKVKYLLIAEAPPDAIERFFYYENVKEKDYLFLSIAQSLYPELKGEFFESGRSGAIKKKILLKLKSDGFYLLDLSELPLSHLIGNLSSQLPVLIDKVHALADEKTKIVLLKVNVYDIAFSPLQERFKNVVDIRIPFPLYEGVKSFAIKFDEALKLIRFRE